MKSFKLTNFTAILAFSAALSCATILSGTSQVVSIDSNVPGAEVKIEGNVVGVTPFSAKIPRQKEAVAIVSQEGYVAQPITLTTSFNPVATLSIFWDLTTTDFLSGAAWEYAPNSYYANLKPADMSSLDFKRETSAKAFAMTYFGDLQTELRAGDGPLLNAFRDEFFQSHTLQQLVQELNALNHRNAVAFGEAVGDLISA